jgi:hypothetical protein
VSSPARPPAPTGASETVETCIPNISPREGRKRLVGGMILFVVGLAVLGVLIAFGAERGWRLLLLPLFWGAGLGFFQWRDKT